MAFGRTAKGKEVLLSKSKYLIGLQCPKALWINYKDKALLPEVDAGTEALFDQGHQVGLLAQKLFPSGIDVGHLSGFDEPVRATRIALSAKKPLFEAAFVYDRCFSRADILEEIPTDFTLNEAQSRQIQSHRTGMPHIDREAIRAFLQRLSYPLYFLDFETIGPAIPLYDRSRPYVQIPFQFSLHRVEFEGALPIHFEFLADGTADPRPDVLVHLKNLLGQSGTIIGYNVDFEIGCLKGGAEVFPEYQNWVDSLLPRFVDLYDVFDALSYYHPSQNGSASLKAVLPALTGTGYDDLDIASGDSAQREFTRIAFGDVTPAERSKVRTALKAYCCRDTRGLIDIVEALKTLIAEPASASHG